MIPYHVITNYTVNDHLVTLNLPKFKRAFFSKWLVPSHKTPFIHIKLDKNGSAVWTRIDGSKNIQAICDAIREVTPEAEQIADLEERTAKFITELYKSRFIKFKEDKLWN